MPEPLVAVSVAVSVIGLEVGPLQVARPLVGSSALLMEMCSGSGLVQTGWTSRSIAGTAQVEYGEENVSPTAAVNCC